MAIQIPGYRIIRKINHGGMSTVYLAIQVSVGRVVALKIMNPGLTSDPSFSERFQREANIVGQLSHPNIVGIYDIGREDKYNYIAMDYLPGGSVHDKMIYGLTGEQALRITKEMANALDHAHEKGYIHRDIKPENILFRADGSAVLTDFGVAKGIGVSRMTHVGSVVGTPHYMSPEQARGQTVDARSDLYSLGVVFYEMLTGSLPYQGDDSVTIALKHISAPIPKFSPQFQAYQKILEKMLAKSPEHRFQRGREISSAIEQLESIVRAPYITNTAAEDLSIVALVRALIAATFHGFSAIWRKIKNFRWSKERGFYQEKSILSSIYDSEITPTIIADRIQQDTYFNQLLKPRSRTIFKWLGSGVLLLIVWCSFSIVTQHRDPEKIAQLPLFLQQATSTTAHLFSKAPATPIDKAPTAPTETTPQTQTETAIVSSASSQATIISEQSFSSAQEVSAASEQRASEAPVIATVAQSDTQSQSSATAQPTYAVTLKVIPEKTRIRLLNTPEKYKDGVELVAGRYQVEISKPGYKSIKEWIEIKNQPLAQTFQLEELPVEEIKTVAPTTVSGGKNAPEMVRISPGNFMMGDDSDPHTAPAHKVVIAKAFSISKFEVTFAEYDIFTRATDRAAPGDNGWGRDNHPVINVTWDDAQAYVQWLSKTTGKKFRLPTEAEWEYVARAGSTTRYWWGDGENDAKGRANCRRGCYSNYSGLFGSKTAPVGSYTPNSFGVYDTAGNVSEWVQDCYQENFSNATSSDDAHEENQCQNRVARGGSTKDNVQRLISSTRDKTQPGSLNETLGFRVVMELN